MTGTAATGTEKRSVCPLPSSSGPTTAPMDTKTATTFRTPAVSPSVATYRYLAATTLMREADTVMRVSHVERSRSPAVVSTDGTKQPRATISTRKSGIIMANRKEPSSRSLATLREATPNAATASGETPSSRASRRSHAARYADTTSSTRWRALRLRSTAPS